MKKDNDFAKQYAEMWNALTDEQKKLILAEEQKKVGRAIVKAKKQLNKRALDQKDRNDLADALKEAKCENISASLADMRVLALRWILSNDGRRQGFVHYVATLQGERAGQKADKSV